MKNILVTSKRAHRKGTPAPARLGNQTKLFLYLAAAVILYQLKLDCGGNWSGSEWVIYVKFLCFSDLTPVETAINEKGL